MAEHVKLDAEGWHHFTLNEPPHDGIVVLDRLIEKACIGVTFTAEEIAEQIKRNERHDRLMHQRKLDAAKAAKR